MPVEWGERSQATVHWSLTSVANLRNLIDNALRIATVELIRVTTAQKEAPLHDEAWTLVGGPSGQSGYEQFNHSNNKERTSESGCNTLVLSLSRSTNACSSKFNYSVLSILFQIFPK